MHLHFVLYKIKVVVFSKAEQKHKKKVRRQSAASCVESIHTKTKQTNKSKNKRKKKNRSYIILFFFVLTEPVVSVINIGFKVHRYIYVSQNDCSLKYMYIDMNSPKHIYK
jgi:uncharacterized ion transporter superfamily protein YfcC